FLFRHAEDVFQAIEHGSSRMDCGPGALLRTALSRRTLADRRCGNPRRTTTEGDMTAYNVVRFRVKPGHEQHFIDAHRQAKPAFKGFRGFALVKTGDRTFCIIGEWVSLQKLAAARPQMIGMLDS